MTSDTIQPVNAKTSERRRYPVGKYRIYDEEFEAKFRRSRILNDSMRATDISNSAILIDLQSSKQTLLELEGEQEGDRSGYYQRGQNFYKASIPIAQESLESVETEFKAWQVKQITTGVTLKKPRNWPENLLAKKLTIEAILDVHLAERDRVNGFIEHYKTQRELRQKRDVLPFGPVGYGLVAPDPRSGREWIIDGQMVGFNSKGVPFIDDPDSPYNKMPVAHYRVLVKDWLDQNRKQAEEDWEKVEDSNLDAMRNKKTGEMIPELHYVRLRKGKHHRVTKEQLPPWPKSATPIDKLGKSE